jgi:hypothetical protein
MATITPEQAAIKWRDRLSASTQQITDGVNSVTTAPGVRAAASKELWANRVMQAKDKWASRVASVPLADWQQSMITVGIPRISQGAAAKVNKVQDFMQKFLPHVNQVAAQVNQMPKGSLEDGIARATAQIRGNAAFKR